MMIFIEVLKIFEDKKFESFEKLFLVCFMNIELNFCFYDFLFYLVVV